MKFGQMFRELVLQDDHHVMSEDIQMKLHLQNLWSMLAKATGDENFSICTYDIILSYVVKDYTADHTLLTSMNTLPDELKHAKYGNKKLTTDFLMVPVLGANEIKATHRIKKIFNSSSK